MRVRHYTTPQLTQTLDQTPGAPVGFSATVVSSTVIALNWAADTTKPPPDDYDLDFSTVSGDGPWTSIPLGLSTTYNHTGQDVTQWHWYRLVAKNGAYASPSVFASARNQRPVFTVAPTTVSLPSVGGTIQYTATDPEGSGITYSLAARYSTSITINSSTGLVTVPSSLAGTSGNITVRATDGVGLFTDVVCSVVVAAVVSETTLLQEDFTSASWYTKWHDPSKVYANNATYWYTSTPPRILRVAPTYTGEGYAPRSGGTGYAIRVTIPSGTNAGTVISFFPRKTSYGANPTELYLEYWLRFSSTWVPTTNGKLPGLSGDFNDGAKGNAWDADGMNGWSARSTFFNPCSNSNQIGFGTYSYHVEDADMNPIATPSNDPGRGFAWSGMACGGANVMLKNTWYKIKVYCKANTGSGAAAQRNGIIRGWLNDVQRAEHDEVMWTRNTAYQAVDRAWMDVYHGGGATAVPNQDIHLFITDVRVWVP